MLAHDSRSFRRPILTVDEHFPALNHALSVERQFHERLIPIGILNSEFGNEAAGKTILNFHEFAE